MRIGLAELDACACEFKRRCGPGLMDQLVGQLRQLRHPAPDIDAIGIELLALQDRIEDAEIGRGVGARACHPLPVRGVAAGIGIDQRVPEPLLAFAPVDQEMLDQERRHHHPHPVVHHAGVPEFAHAGIDDRDSRSGRAAMRARLWRRASMESRRTRAAGCASRDRGRRTADDGRTRASRVRSGICRYRRTGEGARPRQSARHARPGAD